MYEQQVDVPRLLRWYAGHEALPHELLTEARRRLTEHYAAELGEPFVTAGICLYRTGQGSIAWHGDVGALRSARPRARWGRGSACRSAPPAWPDPAAT